MCDWVSSRLFSIFPSQLLRHEENKWFSFCSAIYLGNNVLWVLVKYLPCWLLKKGNGVKLVTFPLFPFHVHHYTNIIILKQVVEENKNASWRWEFKCMFVIKFCEKGVTVRRSHIYLNAVNEAQLRLPIVPCKLLFLWPSMAGTLNSCLMARSNANQNPSLTSDLFRVARPVRKNITRSVWPVQEAGNDLQVFRKHTLRHCSIILWEKWYCKAALFTQNNNDGCNGFPSAYLRNSNRTHNSVCRVSESPSILIESLMPCL